MQRIYLTTVVWESPLTLRTRIFKKAFFEIYEKNYTKAHREFAKTLMLKKYSRQKFADVMHNTVNELAG